MQEGTRYGYIRVSTKEQNEDRQLIAMQEAGIERENTFIDKQSGKDFRRPEWQRLKDMLKQNDTLVIKSIDRMGRNYDEILKQWRDITEMDVGIVVLDMPILDTSKDRDLTGRLIADIVLQLLSYVAQTEREFIRQRQAEGIAAAKLKGTHFGREPMERPPGWEDILRRCASGCLTRREAAKTLGVSHTTVNRWMKGLNERG